MSKEITESELLEILGNTRVSFSEYCKYQFIFRGKHPHGNVTASTFADRDMIYRFGVDRDEKFLSDLIAEGVIECVTIGEEYTYYTEQE